MNSLILDRYNRQPLVTRILSNSLTIAGWSFWAYLWAPLILTIANHFGINLGTSDAGLRMLNELGSTLGGHLYMVSILISLFIIWSLLQELGRNNRRNSKHENENNPFRFHPSPAFRELNLANWRQSKLLVVNYDENTGNIKDVETVMHSLARSSQKAIWETPAPVVTGGSIGVAVLRR